MQVFALDSGAVDIGLTREKLVPPLLVKAQEMKAFDPEFNLRSYFQVKYEDVLDARASKLVPLDLLPLSPNFETGDSISPSAALPQSPAEESTSTSTLSPLYEASLAEDVTDRSSTRAQSAAGTRACARREAMPEPRLPRRHKSGDDQKRGHARRRSNTTPGEVVFKVGSKQAGEVGDTGDNSTASSWNKSVLVRAKPSITQTIERDARYTFVRLPSPDVSSCVAAICTKLGIEFKPGMPTSWFDSKTSLRGPLNCTFFQDMADRRDFVITLVDIGNNGDVGLLLEM